MGTMFPTIVTSILAVIVLALAMRNARLQQELKRRDRESPEE